MLKIRDRLLLGTISGLLASVPAAYVGDRGAEVGFTGYYNAPAVGIATTYLLAITGTEGALWKGAAVGAISGLFRSASRRSGKRAVSAQIAAPVLRLLNRALLGGLSAVFALYLGDDRLFPQPEWPPAQHYSDEDYPYAQTITVQGTPTYGGVIEDF
ncbi:MAG: hypothetical protein GX195_09205 [Firmicutes bacterium]|nr:hypothetical protein [Bacillota bacterium]